MRITFKQLEVFIAIANSENMGQAAERLCLSQSACSMALATLEQQLEGCLFDRYGKRLLLNARGRILLPKAMQLIHQAEELQNLMQADGKSALTGHLIVGASSTIGNYILPTRIAHFMASYPHSRISLRVGNTEQIIQQLLQFQIDIGLIEGRCYHHEVAVKTWKKDQLLVIAAPHYSLPKSNRLSLKTLQTAKWILREVGSGTRARFEEAIGGKIHPFLELGHTEAIKQAVRAGLGLSCLSKATVAEALEKEELIAVKTPFLNLERDFYLITHKEKYQTPTLQSFIETLFAM